MQRIEVSHRIEMGMKTYPGLPEPHAEVLLDYDSSRYGGLSEFYIASLRCCGNTGTDVDAPIHLYRGGTDLVGLSLDQLAHRRLLWAESTSHPGGMPGTTRCGSRNGWHRFGEHRFAGGSKPSRP